MSITGRWRITEMDEWDSDAIDLIQRGFIEFGRDGLGQFGFVAVTGELDCRDAERDGRPGLEFTWAGSDEGTPASGRGWVVLNPDGSLDGHLYFHLGDDSAFHAVPPAAGSGSPRHGSNRPRRTSLRSRRT